MEKTMAALSSETIHANAVAIGGHGVLIIGQSGSGKSDLSLRLIDRGASLVSDDHRHIVRRDGQLFASAPDRLRGKIELRGIGICDVATANEAPLAMIVRLADSYERYPMDQALESIVGVALPVIRINAYEASAPIKIEWALRQKLTEKLTEQGQSDQPKATKGFASL